MHHDDRLNVDPLLGPFQDLAGNIADLNGDGTTDLYVGNDISPHFLFLNKGDGTFEDATDFSGAAASESGGTIAAVTDQDILAAYRFLAEQESVFCEAASAASVAGPGLQIPRPGGGLRLALVSRGRAAATLDALLPGDRRRGNFPRSLPVEPRNEMGGVR